MYLPEGYSPIAPLSEKRVTSFKKAEPVLEQGKDYRAVVETSKGRLVLDLFQDEAPMTVNNFVFLTLHKYYDGVVFHRVLDNFMAQTGDPTGSGRGGPGYTFGDETSNGKRHVGKGILSMANTGMPSSNGSQFFITFVPTPWLDGKHTVFGEVIEGLEVLDKLNRIDPQRPGGAQPDVMNEVYIVAK
ncbi:MAG: peptidylprolyl isomerase [Trueperaceae bacterium]|nr:peptidylprolyl isomerase [Trueperaceae bacterium]